MESKYLKGNLFDLFFSFEGRINRGQYWVTSAFYVLMILISFLPSTLFLFHDRDLIGSSLYFMFAPLLPIMILVYFSSICLIIKRYHDRNKSGYWALLLIPSAIPFLGAVFSLWMFIELGFLEGDKGKNDYGESQL